MIQLPFTTSLSRDILRSPVFSELSNLRPGPHRGFSLRRRLEGLIPEFCPNLSCLQPFCTVHGKHYMLQIHIHVLVLKQGSGSGINATTCRSGAYK